MLKDSEDFEDNSLCELCQTTSIPMPESTDLYFVNYHCIRLRRARKARENKNYKPKQTVF